MLVAYAFMAILGVLYSLLMIGGAYASVESLIDPSWRILVSLPLGIIGALGTWNVAKFFAGTDSRRSSR